MRSEGKRIIFILGIVLSLAILIGFKLMFLPTIHRIYKSPDRQYKLWVYSQAMPFAVMPGQGGSGSEKALVILRTRWGWPLDKSSRYNMGSLISDIRVEWTEKAVWYGKGRAFDLPRPLKNVTQE